MKYWNRARLERLRKREKMRHERAHDAAMRERDAARTYTPGDHQKNVGLMLDALGHSLRRRMLSRLRKEGAMSLSKLSEPLGLKLPAALAQLRILERSGLVSTHKRGRIRFVVLNPEAPKELAHYLTTRGY